MPKPTLTDISIELHVPVFSAVKDFYGKLGFKVVWERQPKGNSGYLVMKRNKSILCFYCGSKQVYKHSFFKKFPKTTPRGYGVEVAIYISDEKIEDFYKHVLKTIGKKYIAEQLKVKPWGSKDFRMIDPFGYYLCMREPQNILKK